MMKTYRKQSFTYLNELVVEVYDAGIQKLDEKYGKCLNVQGEYLEK